MLCISSSPDPFRSQAADLARFQVGEKVSVVGVVGVLVREKLFPGDPANLEAVLHRPGRALEGLDEVGPARGLSFVTREDPHDLVFTDLDAGFLSNLSDQSLGGGLTGIDLTSDEAPIIGAVAAGDCQDVSIRVDDEGENCEGRIHAFLYTGLRKIHRPTCNSVYDLGMELREGYQVVTVGQGRGSFMPYRDEAWISIKIYKVISRKKDGALLWKLERAFWPAHGPKKQVFTEQVAKAKNTARLMGIPFMDSITHNTPAVWVPSQLDMIYPDLNSQLPKGFIPTRFNRPELV